MATGLPVMSKTTEFTSIQCSKTCVDAMRSLKPDIADEVFHMFVVLGYEVACRLAYNIPRGVRFLDIQQLRRRVDSTVQLGTLRVQPAKKNGMSQYSQKIAHWLLNIHVILSKKYMGKSTKRGTHLTELSCRTNKNVVFVVLEYVKLIDCTIVLIFELMRRLKHV